LSNAAPSGRAGDPQRHDFILRGVTADSRDGAGVAASVDAAHSNEKERLTLDELLHAYTINAARLLGREAEIGSITLGKAADLIVLDRRLSAQSTADEVLATKVTKIFFAGQPLKL
jgi:predicted amidohydrolase YtcJ